MEDEERRESLCPGANHQYSRQVEALEARWNNPPTFTYMEEVRKTAEVAAQLTKIIGIANVNHDRIYNPDVTYHMQCLH